VDANLDASTEHVMNTVLVTGASSFLGYHVAKRLNEQGIRPRVLELPGSKPNALDRIDVERCAGDLGDPASVRDALAGADTLIHLAFKVSVAGGRELHDEMRRINVGGTEQLLRAAASAGVRRVVLSGSALSVGVNRDPQPIDETAGPQHEFTLPYAVIRGEAERAALAMSAPGFEVVSVCPSFTFGPDDPTGAPANTLLRKIVTSTQRFTLNVGFGCLDVRDFAAGTLLAAERGRAGERYLLSGENVTANELAQRAAAIAGVRPPWFAPPRFLLDAGVGALELWCGLRGKSAPVTREVVQVIGRYAWYNTAKARTELGWTSRPLQQTLEDTIQWIRTPRVAESRPIRPAVV
jgi:dihydroflavonol-4-reductase